MSSQQSGTYACNSCGTNFNSQNELDQHNRQQHGGGQGGSQGSMSGGSQGGSQGNMGNQPQQGTPGRM